MARDSLCATRMTQPRNVRPGVTWLVTRRATRRHFLFNPDDEGVVEQLYWYTTAVYAQALGIELHVMELMSNHDHEVLTDTLGQLCRFLELRNRAFANALKVFRGWPGEVFDKRSANWVELRSPESIVQQIAYTIVNCVAAGAVRTPRRWPGAKVLVDDIGRRVIRVKRPDFYFDANNPSWPEEVTIPIIMPRQLEEVYGDTDECRRVMQSKVDELVHEAHAKNQREGRGYLGARRVLKTPHTKRANSFEPFGSLTPNFATAGDRELRRALVKERRVFLAHYRAAWRAWRGGDRCVLFPPGTWKMRRHHGAPCHPPPE